MTLTVLSAPLRKPARALEPYENNPSLEQAMTRTCLRGELRRKANLHFSQGLYFAVVTPKLHAGQTCSARLSTSVQFEL